MSALKHTDDISVPLGKRDAFEGVARRHGRRRNPARKLPRSSLRTPANQLRYTSQRWVEKSDRSVANSDTPQAATREHATKPEPLTMPPRPAPGEVDRTITGPIPMVCIT
jgi:hypothetical protein